MLTREENDLLCRVGPGTPMGELMREYWLPGLLSSELPGPDSDPRRIMLLGEKLIAFRDTNGQVGLLQNHCPHRGASLFFGRNEESGLRCVYHGWKFDATGRCVDMPNEPAESDFRTKVSAGAYPTRERGGIIWVYMGSRTENLPSLPDLEGNMLPDDQTGIGIFQRECNWMQALEGDIDTAHVGFLHQGAISADSAPEGSWAKYALSDRAPRFKVLDIDGGVTYGTFRPANPGNTYWRVAHFLFPFYTMVAAGVLGLKVAVRAWVPIDDNHCFGLSMSKLGTQGRQRQPQVGGNLVDAPVRPDSTDWYGRFRFEANAENDFQIDRQKQRGGTSYTGIPSVSLEDHAVTESMGPIYDRTSEHLGSSDAMIIRTRRRLMAAAAARRDRGAIPPGVDQPEAYRLRSGGVVLPDGADWFQATLPLQQAFVEHPGLNLEVLGGVPAV